jgi:hypothetical protein
MREFFVLRMAPLWLLAVRFLNQGASIELEDVDLEQL